MGEEPERRGEKTPLVNLNSKFWRVFLVVLAAFLTFAGPTYVVYALNAFLGLGFTISAALGFVLFMLGLILDLYLIKKKVVA